MQFLLSFVGEFSDVSARVQAVISVQAEHHHGTISQYQGLNLRGEWGHRHASFKKFASLKKY